MELCEVFPKRARQREQKEEKEEKGGMSRGLRKKRGERAVLEKRVVLYYFSGIEFINFKISLLSFFLLFVKILLK
ncbi:hypothetical protein [Aliarcobacter butzleri]|uniref:hypothetical protein n=1 Tax=Aliarcobacter butzleri TaxID=28197 RepID=UPI0021B41FA2|nr:hypothetical protein [Aliarcobacter butzleri]MCT7563135.1 hypothetical protein [Aliarcobacter butzleri]MCT7578610.1 hypothetical protein [Aliarcobacter butzleri]MCT7647550.1 hypothetical protein [Aliarcobacter butzleri]